MITEIPKTLEEIDNLMLNLGLEGYVAHCWVALNEISLKLCLLCNNNHFNLSYDDFGGDQRKF